MKKSGSHGNSSNSNFSCPSTFYGFPPIHNIHSSIELKVQRMEEKYHKTKESFRRLGEMLSALNFSSDSVEALIVNSIDDVEGSIYNMAKDAQGYKNLQRKLTMGSLEDSHKIFNGIINHAVELMTHPFGNHLMETIIVVCDTRQRSQIVHELTKCRRSLVDVSCNEHGTRPARKLIETLETDEQIDSIISALCHAAVKLMKNGTGRYVVESCLKNFSARQNEFLFKAALLHCVDIATNKQGYLTLERCIDYFGVYQRSRLIAQISHYTLHLVQHPHGNFLVQYLIELRIPSVASAILEKLEGKYVQLLMNRYGSYVVEDCFKYAEDGWVAEIVREIMASPFFFNVLVNEFGNFPIQGALKRTKGALHADLVAAVKRYAPALRGHLFGQKVLQCIPNGQ